MAQDWLHRISYEWDVSRKLLDEGYTHEEIAGEIYISIATVRYHVKNIYQKMDVNNKILALRKAKDLNLI